MRLLPLLFSLCLPLPALAQKTDAPATSAGSQVLRHVVFGEVLSLPPAFASAGGTLPDNMQRSEDGFMAEYVPRGEQPSVWNRLTTLTGNRGLGRGVPDAQAGEVALATLGRLQDLYRNACSGALDYQRLDAPPVPGARATAAAWISCSQVQQSGHGEDVVALILVSPSNVFSVQLATRGAGRPEAVPRNPADWAARLAHLAQARVCTPPAGEADPYPSCS